MSGCDDISQKNIMIILSTSKKTLNDWLNLSFHDLTSCMYASMHKMHYHYRQSSNLYSKHQIFIPLQSAAHHKPLFTSVCKLTTLQLTNGKQGNNISWHAVPTLISNSILYNNTYILLLCKDYCIYDWKVALKSHHYKYYISWVWCKLSASLQWLHDHYWIVSIITIWFLIKEIFIIILHSMHAYEWWQPYTLALSFLSFHVDRVAVVLVLWTFDHGLNQVQKLQQSIWLSTAVSDLWLQYTRWM